MPRICKALFSSFDPYFLLYFSLFDVDSLKIKLIDSLPVTPAEADRRYFQGGLIFIPHRMALHPNTCSISRVMLLIYLVTCFTCWLTLSLNDFSKISSTFDAPDAITFWFWTEGRFHQAKFWFCLCLKSDFNQSESLKRCRPLSVSTLSISPES